MSMIKLLYSGAMPDMYEPLMTLMEDPAVFGKKAAAAGIFDYASLMPDKDHVGIHLIALGEFEKYGCYFDGAPVQTANGQKPIEQVQVGDLVLTHKNRYRKVTQTFEAQYDGVKTSIECSGLPEPVVSTANHPYLVVRSDKFTPHIRFNRRRDGVLEQYIDELVAGAEWLAADQVKPGDYMVIPCNPECEEKIELPESADPYVLGLYVAEGCLAKEYRNISTKGEYKTLIFTVSDKDAASIDYLQSWFVKQGRDSVAELDSHTSEYGVRLQYGIKELAEAINLLFGHLAHTKRVHPTIFTQDREFKLKFLAGYFDGDGSINTDATKPTYVGTIQASTVSRDLAYDLQRLCASVGVTMSVSLCHNYDRNRTCEGFGKGKGDLPIYAMSVGSTTSNLVLAHCLRLAPHTKLGKYGGSHIHTSGNYILAPVRKITHESVENEVKRNLEVEEDNSYVVDIQGHNSNRNFDSFPREACINYHDTFVKYGHLHRHHRNKPDDDKLGKIAASAYNPDMGRIELFVHANKEACAPELAKLEKNGELSFSMACSVQSDRCNICNTLRRNAKDPNQCEHIRDQFGKMAEDGTIVCTHNDEPKFFDISFVYRPADRIAWSLKQASSGNVDSIKLASDLGYDDEMLDSLMLSSQSMQKRAIARRLADMQDRYFAMADRGPQTGEDHVLWELRKAGADVALDDASIEELRVHEPTEVFSAMSRRGMVLDVRSFLKYAMGNDMGVFAQVIDEIERSLPGEYSRQIKTGEISDTVMDETFDADPCSMEPRSLAHTLNRVRVVASDIKTAEHRVIERSLSGDNPEVLRPDIFKTNLPSALVKAAVARYSTYKLAAVNAVQTLRGNLEARQIALLASQDIVNKKPVKETL